MFAVGVPLAAAIRSLHASLFVFGAAAAEGLRLMFLDSIVSVQSINSQIIYN